MRKLVVVSAAAVGLALLAIVWLAALPRMTSVTPVGAAFPNVSIASDAQPVRVALKANMAGVPSEAERVTVHATARAPMNAPQIARTGAIDVYVTKVDDAVAGVSELARREGGVVFALQVANAGDAGAASATMQIRVPSDRFESAMESAARIGKVRDKTIAAQDLTADLTDSDARLTNLRQTEADIRKIMDRSGDVADVLQAESQLSDVREQIETLEAQLRTMRGQVAYATIDVTLQAEAGTSPVEPTAAAQLATAWRAAVHALSQTTVAIAAFALWVVAFLPYLAVAALAGLLLYRYRLHSQAFHDSSTGLGAKP